MQRRTLIILGLSVGALLLVGILIYVFFFMGRGGEVQVGQPTDPFGSAGDYQGNGNIPDVGVSAPGAGTQITPRLIKITDGPVAYGVGTISILPVAAASSSPAIPADTEVRYVERASGHVYAYRAVARTLTRLTNQTLPGIEEAAWAPDATRVFMRFLSGDAKDRVETYALPVEPGNGYFLESNLEQVTVDEAGTVLSLLSSGTGSVGTAADINGGNVRTLFSTSLSALRTFPGDDIYVAHTKASVASPGYGFVIGASGAFERLLGPLRGLALIPSPVGSTVFYSYLSGQSLQTALIDIDTRDITPLPIATLAEKCVWVPDGLAVFCAVPRSLSGTLPDDWYQGAVSTSDRIWRVDLESRVATLVLDPSQSTDVAIDAVSLAIDVEAEFLFFTNRADGSLWAFSL